MSYDNSLELCSDEAAERNIIKSVLVDNDIIREIIKKVDSEDFCCGQNREIMEAVFALYCDNKNISSKNVLHEMKEKGTFKNGLEEYIMSILNSSSELTDPLVNCVKVKGYGVLRRLSLFGDNTMHMIKDAPDKAERKVQLLDQLCRTVQQYRPDDGFQTVSELISSVYEEIVNASVRKEIKEGLSTGFRGIDKMIEGLYPKDVVVIAARPAMGKTSLGLNIALNVARTSGKTVAIYSAESAKKQIISRLLSMEGLVDAKRLLKGSLLADEWERLSNAATTLGRMDIRINDNLALSVEEIASQCGMMDNLGLIVIDYLQLFGMIDGVATRSNPKKLAKICRKIKNMAEMLDVPVVLLSQVNRRCESRKDKRPRLSDLNMYDTLIEDADVIIGLYREYYYDSWSDRRNDVDAIVLKNTRGWCGTVPLNWESEYLSFTDKEGEPPLG